MKNLSFIFRNTSGQWFLYFFFLDFLVSTVLVGGISNSPQWIKSVWRKSTDCGFDAFCMYWPEKKREEKQSILSCLYSDKCLRWCSVSVSKRLANPKIVLPYFQSFSLPCALEVFCEHRFLRLLISTTITHQTFPSSRTAKDKLFSCF